MAQLPLTLKQAAEQLGVGPSALRMAIARGKLTSMKVGRDHFIEPKELERYRKDYSRPRRRR